MTGPQIKVSMTCAYCTHVRSYANLGLGDSASDVYCTHPDNGDGSRRFIADTDWTTPKWCPMRKEAIDKAVQALSE